MDLNFVVRRLFWFAEDETKPEYLTGNEQWSPEPSEAWIYGSEVAFTDAKLHGGGVCIRLPSGREVNVLPSDFIGPEKNPAEPPSHDVVRPEDGR